MLRLATGETVDEISERTDVNKEAKIDLIEMMCETMQEFLSCNLRPH